MSRAKSVLELLQHGQIVFRLFEGETVVAGRGGDSDWVVHDGSVSRDHARLNWLPGTSPAVVDLGSQNGTYLGGEALAPDEPRPLLDGEVLSLGAVDYRIRLAELGFAPASILDSDTPPDPPGGRFRGWREIRRCFLRLEDDRSTGTLVVTSPEGARRVTVFLGSLVLEAMDGVALLRSLASAPASVRYSFTTKLEIGTQPTEGCLPSELIRTCEQNDGSHSTDRYTRPPEGSPGSES